MNNLEHIYYRGCITWCNFHCSYCPFAKKDYSAVNLENDKKAIKKFVDWVENTKFRKKISIMFIPYGEAMIYEHTMDAMVKLSTFQHVRAISCQTNLSFNAENFVEKIKTKGNSEKIKLWATFHPEMIDKIDFTKKCNFLNKFIELTVGAVAIPENIKELKLLKSELTESIYFWLNDLDTRKGKYSTEILQEFKTLDKYFIEEKHKFQADINLCTAYHKSLFINSVGDVQACVKSSAKIGNIYKNRLSKTDFCKAKFCDCFLSFANRKDYLFPNENKMIRIPKPKHVQAMFFDIDGTLINHENKLEKSTIDWLKENSSKFQFYFVTSLPFEFAMEKCQIIKQYFKGGIFAGGGEIRLFEPEEIVHVPIPKTTCSMFKMFEPKYIYSVEKGIFRIAIEKSEKNSYVEIKNKMAEKVNVSNDGEMIGITARSTSKYLGIKKICKMSRFLESEVVVVGNEMNDLEMLRNFENSVVVPTAKTHAKKAANFICKIENLSMFFYSHTK